MKFLKDKRGFALIFAFMVLLTMTVMVLGYSFLIVQEMKNSKIELSRQQALYIAEAGIERAMEYLEDDTDWSDDDGTAIINENFAAGSYSVDLSNGTTTTIVVTSAGTVGSGPNQVRRQISQKIRRLPEAFNYALFSNSTNALSVQGIVEINGGDLYARGNITDGTLNVSGGGAVSASSGGLVYSEGSVTAGGTYSVGTAPNHTPAMPTLDTTYYDDIMSGYDSDIATYNTSTSYLGYTGAWTPDPNGTVNITLTGNILYYAKFTAKAASTITGYGAIVSNDEVKLEDTTSVAPSGGTIIIVARNKVEIKDSSTVGANTTIYYSGLDDKELKTKDSVSVSGSTLLSADKIKIEGGTVSNSTLYSTSSDQIEVKNSSTTISDSILLSRKKIKISDEATVTSSVLYITSAADKIEVKDSGTSVDGAIISGNKFKLDKEAQITGLVYAFEAELKEGTINGSLVTDSFSRDEIAATGPRGMTTVTINYDHIDYSYFPEAPAGLGLDIDGDASEEGTIIRVPNAWQEL